MFHATVRAALPQTFQAHLFGGGMPTPDPTFRQARRQWLDDQSWLEIVPGWLAGADALYQELVECLPWDQRRVPMYDRVVDEPRLTWWWQEGAHAAGPSVLHELRLLISIRFGVVFDSIGCNLYRSGRDSVAWHRDRVATTTDEPVIVLLTLGGTRPFIVRPLGGGPSLALRPAAGDLVVMGGRAQLDWEHCVPKVAHAEPRLSVVFRHGAETTGLRGAKLSHSHNDVVVLPRQALSTPSPLGERS
jgi:alkylated DNA repair dioxygenase AlkB